MEVFIGNLSAKMKLVELHNILGEHEMHSDFTTHEGKACDHRHYQLEVREYIHREHPKKAHWAGEGRRINEQLPLNL